MLTVNHIVKEIKNVPLHRLEEVYNFVVSITVKNKTAINDKEKILSFGGAFSDMESNEFSDFIAHTKHTRKDLFERNFDK